MRCYENDLAARNGLVAGLVALLSAGDVDEVLRRAPNSRVSAQQLREAICQYGKTLVPLPPESHELIDYVVVAGTIPPKWSVAVPLFTQEEGRSDLSLELVLSARASGGHCVEIDDIHVL